MNTMFQVDDFFVRIRDKGGRMKLTVWNGHGNKIISEFITTDHSGNFWNLIENHSSESVVNAVKERLYS